MLSGRLSGDNQGGCCEKAAARRDSGLFLRTTESRRLCGHQLAQYVGQNTAVLVVIHFDRRIDPC